MAEPRIVMMTSPEGDDLYPVTSGAAVRMANNKTLDEAFQAKSDELTQDVDAWLEEKSAVVDGLDTRVTRLESAPTIVELAIDYSQTKKDNYDQALYFEIDSTFKKWDIVTVSFAGSIRFTAAVSRCSFTFGVSNQSGRRAISLANSFRATLNGAGVSMPIPVIIPGSLTAKTPQVKYEKLDGGDNTLTVSGDLVFMMIE